jgi:glycerophosphoryl diester phosphodiesterase
METDVRVTADAVPIAVHDPDFLRVSGRDVQVSSSSWHDVSTIRLADGREPPRLEDLLGTWPELRWNIDVKQKEAAAPVAEAIKRTGSANRVLIAAFSARRTAMVRSALGPELGGTVATGAGRLAIALLLGAKVLPSVKFNAGADAAQVPVRRRGVRIVDPAFVRVCHKLGVAVHVWTVDDASEMGRLLDLGVDGIMTDRPSILKEVLRQRGQWV